MHIFIKDAKNGEYVVDFDGDNGETVAVTETYKSKASAKHAIEVIKREAATAWVSDITSR